jgi:hypothetical protein
MPSLVAAACLLLVGLIPDQSNAQAVTKQAEDPVTIVGTWATGSGQVETGLVSR